MYENQAAPRSLGLFRRRTCFWRLKSRCDIEAASLDTQWSSIELGYSISRDDRDLQLHRPLTGLEPDRAVQ